MKWSSEQKTSGTRFSGWGYLWMALFLILVVMIFSSNYSGIVVHDPFVSAKTCHKKMREILDATVAQNRDSKIPIGGIGGITKKPDAAGLLKAFILCPGGLVPYPPPDNFWMKAYGIIPENLQIKLFSWSFSTPYHQFCLERAGCYIVAPGASYSVEISSGSISVSCPHHGTETENITGKISDVTSSNTTSQPGKSQSGRFTRDSEGVITDSATNLQWFEGPDKATNWNEAQTWINSLGNGWHTPARDELKGIYIADSTRKGGRKDQSVAFSLHLDPAFQLDKAYFVWSEARKDSGETYAGKALPPSAYYFQFEGNGEAWAGRAYSDWKFRALAVRSPK
ncbi:MAG: hypothetical protein HQM09_08435 [Candidatus Riflebacteria bacterium]|nr:hypothetical protein [Candidatus Riflebacteria bacterium]